LCEGLQALGCEVNVFTTNANGRARLAVPLSQPLDVDGVQVWYFPLKYNGLGYFYSPEQAQAVKTSLHEYDLAVTDAVWGHGLASVAEGCKLHKKPYIVSLRGQLMPWALEQKKLKKQFYLSLKGRRMLQSASALHCTNQDEAEIVKSMKLTTPAFVVPNGIDFAVFGKLPPEGALRKRLEIPDDTLLLLFLGRLHKNKRPDIAIDVLKHVQSLNKDVRLVFAGPDEEGLIPALREKARDVNCEERVYFTGLLDQNGVIDALIDADLLLMPSEVNENFGMSAVEAMAAGVPVLVSDGVPVGKDAEQVGAGKVAPCTHEAFSAAALEMLSKPDELRKMGEKGRALVREKYDISVVARDMLAQFRAIFQTGSPIS
jgi:glycosyltransferase involved in cell wall biosynthesis